MCSTCFEGGLLSWTPFTSFVLSNSTTFQLLMILLVFTHIKQYALVPSQYPKNTWSMDLDFNLLLFSLRMCAYVLQLKILKWDIHHTFYSPCFLPGLWIKNFGWALIFDVNCHVHHLHPNSKSSPCAWIIFLTHFTMVMLVHFAIIFCCGV
jgi:hypothetical protein